MKKEKDIQRNRPVEEGRNNDPHVRDESGIQPGVQTNSNSDYDVENQSLSDTATGDLSTEKDPNADRRFDEADRS